MMIILALRVLKIYFRDRTAVFFSLLSSLIMIGLYILFLGKVYSGNISGVPQARLLMDEWIMAGILATTSVTTTLAAFNIMVDDVKSIQKDWVLAPVRRHVITGGYLIAAFLIGWILSLLSLVFAMFYLRLFGGDGYSLVTWLQIIGALTLIVLTNASMTFCFASFFKSRRAFSTAQSILATLIGFLAGIYIPVGMLPNTIQWLVSLFPTTHGVALLRQIMMDAHLQLIPKTAALEICKMYGVVIHFGDFIFSRLENAFYLILFAVILFMGGIYGFYYSKKH